MLCNSSSPGKRDDGLHVGGQREADEFLALALGFIAQAQGSAETRHIGTSTPSRDRR